MVEIKAIVELLHGLIEKYLWLKPLHIPSSSLALVNVSHELTDLVLRHIFLTQETRNGVPEGMESLHPRRCLDAATLFSLAEPLRQAVGIPIF